MRWTILKNLFSPTAKPAAKPRPYSPADDGWYRTDSEEGTRPVRFRLVVDSVPKPPSTVKQSAASMYAACRDADRPAGERAASAPRPTRSAPPVSAPARRNQVVRLFERPFNMIAKRG